MPRTPSEIPIVRRELARMEDRLTFLYVERAVVNRKDNALTVLDSRGIAHVPATTLSVLMLGPGTRITNAAIALLGDAGCTVVWGGTGGVRYYAHGRPPAKSSRMAEAQARIVTNQRRRLQCAREMYGMRFPGEDVSRLTMSQLRGREGARVKRIYAAEAERTGVDWNRRRYDPNDFDAGDPINRALTTANAALYGITHAVIVGLGFVPSLGVVHTGTDRAFVYDIADLYKAETAIPAAFECAGAPDGEIGGRVRRALRHKVKKLRVMKRMVRDLYSLMKVEGAELVDVDLMLWNELEVIASGVNWGPEDDPVMH